MAIYFLPAGMKLMGMWMLMSAMYKWLHLAHLAYLIWLVDVDGGICMRRTLFLGEISGEGSTV